MVDIHSRAKNLDRNTEKYISKLYPEDREDARRYIDELLAQGYSAGRVDKYLSSFVSISRMLKVSFRDAKEIDVKRYAAQLEGPEAYLWCKLPTQNNPKFKNSYLSYGFIGRLLNELALKAGIKKAVNPHAFRHSRATFMAKHLNLNSYTFPPYILHSAILNN